MFDSAAAMEEFALWQAFDDALDTYCFLPEEDVEAEYVDLLLNPERFTGYRGISAHRIWHSIYLENCFRLVSFNFLSILLLVIAWETYRQLTVWFLDMIDKLGSHYFHNLMLLLLSMTLFVKIWANMATLKILSFLTHRPTYLPNTWSDTKPLVLTTTQPRRPWAFP